jgi:hypothetical protein
MCDRRISIWALTEKNKTKQKNQPANSCPVALCIVTSNQQCCFSLLVRHQLGIPGVR